MAAVFDVIKQTKGKFTGDEAMAILKNWKNPDIFGNHSCFRCLQTQTT